MRTNKKLSRGRHWPSIRELSQLRRLLLLLVMLVTAVTGIRAQAYITDVAVVGASGKNEANDIVNSWRASGWQKLDRDLNEDAGGWYVYLLYKTSSTANPETGYITDLLVSERNAISITKNGRTYYRAQNSSNFDGDLNKDAGGKYIYLYYTRDRANLENEFNGSRRVITSLTAQDHRSNTDINWYLSENSGSADVNHDAGGDYIYISMDFALQRLKMTNHPTMTTNAVFDGTAQNLVSKTATGNYGTMMYSVDGSSYSSNLPKATTVGNHTVKYYLSGGNFAYDSDVFTATATVLPPMVKASNLKAAFSQSEKKVTLTWDNPLNVTFNGYNWKIYRGNQHLGTTSPGLRTYTDTGFDNESDVTYTVYYAPDFYGDNLKTEGKATTTVNTTRSVPVYNLTAESQDDRIKLTWTSIAYPTNQNNKFDVYIDGEKVTTITPEEGQTAFTWEHIDNNLAGEPRVDNTNSSSEDLDACNPHTYRIVGQIDDKELNSATEADKTIGGGTVFESVQVSKGDNQGSVLLTWNVRRLEGQAQAETYIIERRVMKQEKDEDNWQKLTTMDSDKTFLTYEDKTPLPGVFYEYRITCYNYCENGNRPATTADETGFAMSSGVVSGRITYGTGTAVDNVKVTLLQNNEDGEVVSHLHSLLFTGPGTGMLCTTNAKEVNKLAGSDFSVQAYVNPDNLQMGTDGESYVLYDVAGAYTIVLKYDAAQQAYQLGTVTGGSSQFSNVYIPAGKWSHVTCVYSKSAKTSTFYVTADADHITTGTIESQNIGSLDSGNAALALGNSVTLDDANNFRGYLDEFRFFKRALNEADIQKNFNHPMSGTETGLAIYYPMDENMGVQSIIYDFSKSNNVSNGHHAKAVVPAQSSDYVPTEEQLSLMSLTDAQGNFVIRGVPFSGEGTNYTIVPTYGIHEFSPAYLSRYVSATSLVHSAVDFEDVSAFPVSGKVRYAGTDYPVEDCSIYVDGQLASKDGEPITTNADGEFTVSVPIGDHFVQIKKNGHEFAGAGRYPADPNETGLRHTFDRKISGLEFIDETLVNFTGRVVGGSIEGDKAVGFGLSQNNIGVAEIVLSPLNELYRMNVVKNVTETSSSLDTNTEEVAVASATENINSTAVRGATADYAKKIFIRTDPATGEFSAMLPPLQYKIESVKVKKSGLEVGKPSTIDLTNPSATRKDSISTESGELLTYEYNTKLNQIYHSTPSFTVEQEGSKDGHFGIDSFTLTDDLGELEVNDIYTKDEATGAIEYTYGGAVFVKDDKYTFKMKGFEEYTNADEETVVTTRVPLSGVIITIDNALSSSQSVYLEPGTVGDRQVVAGDIVELKSNQLQMDDEGEATYTWAAGLPNIAEPYTRTLSISYEIDNRTYQWDGSGMTGIILGELPTGNNFVTAGPDKLLMILRDPPGSGSSAEWTTGSSVTTSTVRGNKFIQNTQVTTKWKFGFKNAVITGTPIAGTITEAETKDELEIGGKMESEGERSTTQVNTVTITKSIATKGEPEYVGHEGDVFVGTATNIIFGNARNLGFQRDGSNGVKLGLEDVITTGLKFGTMFNYTLKYIEETLFPNFKTMRNRFLTTVSSQAEIDAYKNTGTGLVYLTLLNEDDKHFGESGTYTIKKPQQMEEHVLCDSVLWVNTQIENWTNYLSLNEEEKVKAFANRPANAENHSFDSGTDYTFSKEIEDSHTSTWDWTVSAGLYVDNTASFELAGNGFELHIEDETMGGRHEVDEDGNTEVNSFSYTLAESGDADALTVDVYEYGNFGPIFRTRGGQTSAPYEGEVVTKYYERGTVIMEATMQIEVPQIDVDVPVVSDIPTGSAANYTLKLGNSSEVGADVAYRLALLDETNANGAQLTIDGKTLTGEGRLIKVPGNQSLSKALQLRQTDLSELDYKDIGIVFTSDSDPEEIADTIYISAHFVPSSSTVDLTMSNSIMNTQTGTDLKLTFSNFDRNYKNLKAFRLQYKKQGSTDWTQLHEYVLDEQAVTQNNELLPAGASISYTLPMDQFTDGDYLFRVLSVATYGPDEVYRTSEELALVKDMQRPRPLGQPEPANGILAAGDELSVTFNEAILKGELTQAANFKVTGVLNGAEVAHETALSMQNTTATATTESSIVLAGKDFSLDAWVNLAGGEGTLLSHGIGTAKLTVGTDAQNHLVVNIGNETYTSDNVVPTDAWTFLSLSYTNENGQGKLNVSAAKDADITELFVSKEVARYEGDGPLTVGKQASGAMHELLLWDEAHNMTEALQQRYRTKNPSTRHLIGYWKMDEGEGKTIRDYARNRHMTMADETWYLNNVNKALTLTSDEYLNIDASELPAYNEDDYALEFWVRGNQQTGEAQLLQMGEVGLWLNDAGELQLTGKGSYLATEEQTSQATSSGNLMDNSWHHIALNVLRQGAAAVYVDGVRRLSTNAANVGAIATNNLLLGAHRKTDSTVHGLYSYDRPFAGQIDEVRVWNATLNADKLLSNRKVRLTGKEDGLVAYYPFETKQLDGNNQVVTVGTAADLCGSSKVAQVLTLDAQTSTLNYADEAPALRTKPTETNVPFTFVASDNKVVITINEDAAAIEGCTLNFTVRDLRDENGNYSTPAIWSAFISQNPLAWSESSLTAEQPENTTGTLKATVVNKGGTQQMWTLSGMPAWLVADTENGQTNPTAETQVTFTIMPSAPIGRNEVTVYLTGNDNIDTPLTLSVNVTGNKPAWSVDPYAFENSMNVIGQLFVDGIESEDADDVVAAFIGEECRGVANLQYSARYDRFYVTMDIYGNSNDDNKEVTFRAYDASTGTLYPVVTPANEVTYSSLALNGNYAEPNRLSTADYIEQTNDLKKGWNWISFFVNADDMTPQSVFESITDDVDVVKSQNDGFVQITNNGDLQGNLTALNNYKMYAVKMNSDRTLRIVGTRPTGKVSLAEHWTWMGYGQKLASVDDAMADMKAVDGDIVKGQKGVTYFDVYAWSGSLLTLQPGQGYQVNSATAKEFSFPSTVTGAAASRKAAREAVASTRNTTFSPVNYHLYPDNMIMTAKVIMGNSTLTDAEIGVFAGEECRATAFTGSDGRAYITVPGDETCELTLKVVIGGKVYEAEEAVDFTVDAIHGSYDQPFVINLNTTAITDVEAAQPRESTVYDLQGRKIVVRQSEQKLRKGIYVENGKKKVLK